MEFLDSVKTDSTQKRSQRVQSWYLYEQYKSLEKSQTETTQKMKEKSYQEKLLQQELFERRARRRVLRRGVTRGPTTSTSDVHSCVTEDGLFESLCDDEVCNNDPSGSGDNSPTAHYCPSPSSNSYSFTTADSPAPKVLVESVANVPPDIEDEFVEPRKISSDSSIKQLKSEETVSLHLQQPLAITSSNLALSSSNLALSSSNLAVSSSNLAISGNNLAISGGNLAISDSNLAISGSNLADDVKQELEGVKKIIEENLDAQMERLRESEECLKQFMLDSPQMLEDELEMSTLMDSEEESDSLSSNAESEDDEDFNLQALWSKLVSFAYQIVQLNHGNCYYDYSSQLLTAVLACDVLRRGVNKMCNILQPYISPIKFTETCSSSIRKNKNRSKENIQKRIKIKFNVIASREKHGSSNPHEKLCNCEKYISNLDEQLCNSYSAVSAYEKLGNYYSYDEHGYFNSYHKHYTSNEDEKHNCKYHEKLRNNNQDEKYSNFKAYLKHCKTNPRENLCNSNRDEKHGNSNQDEKHGNSNADVKQGNSNVGSNQLCITGSNDKTSHFDCRLQSSELAIDRTRTGIASEPWQSFCFIYSENFSTLWPKDLKSCSEESSESQNRVVNPMLKLASYIDCILKDYGENTA